MANKDRPGLPRRLADHAIAALSLHKWPRRRPSIAVVTYHRVLPRRAEAIRDVEPGMFVHDDTLESQVGQLKKDFDLVDLSDWIRDAESGVSLPRRAAAITFDDGWLDNYEFAFPVLRSLGATATIFVVPDLVGRQIPFWPDRLALVLSRDARHDHRPDDGPESARSWLRSVMHRAEAKLPLGADDLARVIAVAKTDPEASVASHVDALFEACGGSAGDRRFGLADWEQIKEMSSSGVFRVGSHSASHRRLLDSVSDDDLHAEIVGSRHSIEERTGGEVGLFCYPNGDYCDRALEMVRSNYAGACSTMRGWNSAGDDRFLLRRISLHESRSSSTSGLKASLSGLP